MILNSSARCKEVLWVPEDLEILPSSNFLYEFEQLLSTFLVSLNGLLGQLISPSILIYRVLLTIYLWSSDNFVLLKPWCAGKVQSIQSLFSWNLDVQGKYKVYNLCSERLYDGSLFQGKVRFSSLFSFQKSIWYSGIDGQ